MSVLWAEAQRHPPSVLRTTNEKMLCRVSGIATPGQGHLPCQAHLCMDYGDLPRQPLHPEALNLKRGVLEAHTEAVGLRFPDRPPVMPP
jgi:hypothetical protein